MTNEKSEGSNACVVCGKAVSEDEAVMHRYHEGRRFALCCPTCAEMFNRAPDRFARGERPLTIVQELLDQMRWKDS
jgi:YHS domain-containing protein